MKQGGKDSIDFVKKTLSCLYTYIDKNDFMEFIQRFPFQAIYSEQVIVGENIYGKCRRVDFILYHPILFPDNLIIECKWQSDKGTIDQKYPFIVLNIELSKINTVIVLDGGGYSVGARRWLQFQSTSLENFLALYSLSEFQNKIFNEHFLGQLHTF